MSTPPVGGPPSAPTSTALEPSKDERTLAFLAHISGLFAGFLGPLIIWAVRKEDSRFVAYHGLQALIFNSVLAALYLFIAVPFSLVTCGLGTIFIFPLYGLQVAAAIIYGLKANEGKWDGYPGMDHFGADYLAR